VIEIQSRNSRADHSCDGAAGAGRRSLERRTERTRRRLDRVHSFSRITDAPTDASPRAGRGEFRGEHLLGFQQPRVQFGDRDALPVSSLENVLSAVAGRWRPASAERNSAAWLGRRAARGEWFAAPGRHVRAAPTASRDGAPDPRIARRALSCASSGANVSSSDWQCDRCR